MKHNHQSNKNTGYTLFLLLLFFIVPLRALNLQFHPKVGGSTSISMTDVKTLTFSGGNLIVNKKDTATRSFSLVEMAYVDFSSFLTAISPTSTNKTVLIFPNPVSDVLSVELQLTGGQFVQLEIIGIDGKVCLQTLLNSPTTKISVSALPKGLYLCRVQNSEERVVTKFIKQ